MSDDRMLAELLGEAPSARDPGFRFDVFARVAERARRRAARRRAARYALAFTLIGLVFPLARLTGLTLADAEPWLLAGGVLALAYALAVAAIDGPRALLTRSLLAVRALP